jgi:hypothetical protein
MKILHLFILLFSLQIIEAQTPNQNISNGVVFDGEPYIAINHNNPQHLVVAWMGWKLNNLIVIKTKRSIDGGTTWSTESFIPHTQIGLSSADPSIQFDNNGNVYVCFIDYDNQNFTQGAIYTSKSTDGGITWQTPVEVISLLDCPNKFCIDRPWMVIDNSNGLNEGTIYVTSMNANQTVAPPYNPYLTVSTNGGVSYEVPRFIDTLNFYAGNSIAQPMPAPAVSADGIFYAIYPSYLTSQSVFGHNYLAKSTDKGSTITHSSAMQSSGGSVTDNFAKKGYLLKTNPGNADHLAFFFLAQLSGDADIYMVETLNGGANWSAPLRINQDPIGNGALQDLVWADFDNDGDLAVCWRDRRNAGAAGYQVASEIWGAIRYKDSTQFSQDFLVSNAQAPHDVVLEGSGNDFMCVQLHDDILYAVWGDVRNSKVNIWLNKIDISTGLSSLKEVYSKKYVSLYPNPTHDYFTIDSDATTIKFTLYDNQGQLIKSGKSFNKRIEISELPIGIYILSLNINGEEFHQKITKQ